MLACLYVTFNKGSLIFTVAGLAIAFLRPRWASPAIALFLVSVIAFLIVAYALLSDSGSSELATNTILVRVHLWYAAVTVFDNEPLVLALGDGLKYMTYAASTYADWTFPTSHNTWLDQVLFYGVPGLLAYFILWFSALSTAARNIKLAKDQVTGAITRGLYGCLAALMGELIFEPRADGSFQVAQVFLYIGLVTCQAVILENERSHRPTESGHDDRDIAGGKSFVP
jgi:hypothetical protein